MMTRTLQVSALVLTLSLSGVFACSSDPNQGSMCGGAPQGEAAGSGCKKGYYSDDGGKTCKPHENK